MQPRKQMRCEIGCGEHRQALWNLNILGNLQMACCSTGVEGSGSNIPSGFLKQGTLTGAIYKRDGLAALEVGTSRCHRAYRWALSGWIVATDDWIPDFDIRHSDHSGKKVNITSWFRLFRSFIL